MIAQIIGDRYELTAPISRGGMGQVWRGYDVVLDRDIAVKLIRLDVADSDESREELIKRFKREARVTAKIEHPGVPSVYDAAFDSDIDRLYLVMQLVRGVSLADVLAERGALTTTWAAAVAAQICTVLSYAHAVPIVHRDLKPGNVMIARGGTVKVLDFGVAAVLRSGVTKLTSTGSIIGTKPYMSPEQIQNAPVTPQSDLYALGCLLHEMLSGQRVFDAADEIALMYQHLEKPPTPLRDLVADVPAALEQLVLDLLAKRPADRPYDAWAVYDRLVPFLPQPEPRGPDTELPAGSVPDPTRPYRVPGGGPRPRPSSALPLAASDELPGIEREDIEQALEQAAELVEDDRFTQASDLLTELLAAATNRFGADDAGVVNLRVSYAAALFLGGDYRRAAPQFDALVASFGRLHGPNAESTLDFRRQAAFCRIELGETDEAVDDLELALRGYESLDREAVRDVLDLRLTMTRLRLGAGRPEDLADDLAALLHDARQKLPPDDELTAEIEQMVARVAAGDHHRQ